MPTKYLLLLMAAALTACSSYIADDEQLIYVRPADVARAVLIEDFTGQRCVNCPDAAEEIVRLKQQYGDTAVIAVGIHSGPLAVFSTPTVVGLRTADGDAYYDHWAIDREPLGYINRAGTIATHDKWATLVHDAIQQPAAVTIALAAHFDDTSRRLTVSATVMGLDPYSGTSNCGSLRAASPPCR